MMTVIHVLRKVAMTRPVNATNLEVRKPDYLQPLKQEEYLSGEQILHHRKMFEI